MAVESLDGRTVRENIVEVSRRIEKAGWAWDCSSVEIP